MADLLYHGSTVQLRSLLAKLPRVCAGLEADQGGVVRSFMTRIGIALLSQVQQDFITKSRGGIGRDGIKWKPMKPASIAARRITAGEKKAAGIKGKRTRGLLTTTQDAKWRKIFAVRKGWLMAKGMDAGTASARAASIAWAVLKSEGALTRLAVFGNRQIEMVRDTNHLFDSLSPGVEDRPSGADEQVFDVAPGRVTVGSNVPYAGRQFRMRQPWPTDGSIPAAWWPAILGAARRGLVRIVALMVGGRLR
jgi:hypothetical protein